jgi:hypothetical protein
VSKSSSSIENSGLDQTKSLAGSRIQRADDATICDMREDLRAIPARSIDAFLGKRRCQHETSYFLDNPYRPGWRNWQTHRT